MQSAVDIFVNRQSGTVLSLGEDAVRAKLEETFGARLGHLHFVEPAKIGADIKSWLEQNGKSGRGLIVGGGDGTALTAATEAIKHDDVVLGVLPLGTHNLFSRQLGFSTDFNTAVKQYKNTYVDRVEVGQVNGHYFLCGVLVDQQSIIYYAAREHFRKGDVFAGLRDMTRLAKAVFFGKPQHMKVTFANGTSQIVEAHAMGITNNLYAPKSADDPLLDEKPVKKVIENALNKSGGDGKIGVYGLRVGILNAPSLISAFLKGTWTSHDRVTVLSDTKITVSSLVEGKKTTQIALDGEVRQTEFPLQFKLLAPGLKVYRPR